MVLCEFEGASYVTEIMSTAKNGTLSIHYGNKSFEDIAADQSQERLKKIDEVPLQIVMQARGNLRDQGILFKLQVRC